jgi:hypothetical protein
MAWFALSAVYVVVATHMFGPARAGAFSQLATEPRFLMESLLGAAAILWTSLLAFRAAIPAALTRQFAVGSLVLMALWLAQYVIGLVSPALEPSMVGKRSHCYYETMMYSLPPIVVGLHVRTRTHSFLAHSTGPADGAGRRSDCLTMAPAPHHFQRSLNNISPR